MQSTTTFREIENGWCAIKRYADGSVMYAEGQSKEEARNRLHKSSRTTQRMMRELARTMLAQEMNPCRNAIAVCSLGYVGIIECDEPKEVTYADGNKAFAWVGTCLWPKELFGKAWTSRNPQVLYIVQAKKES